MDAQILLWLNSWVGEFRLLDASIRLLVSDYFVPVLETLALLGLWFYGEGKSRLANQFVTIRGALAIGFANAITMTINHNYFRPRPFTNLEVDLLFYRPTDGSFPANAAAVGFAIATAVFITHRRLGIALYVLAFLWSFARVFAGVHYPSDAVGGAAVGVLAALGGLVLTKILARPVEMILAVARRAFLA